MRRAPLSSLLACPHLAEPLKKIHPRPCLVRNLPAASRNSHYQPKFSRHGLGWGQKLFRDTLQNSTLPLGLTWIVPAGGGSQEMAVIATGRDGQMGRAPSAHDPLPSRKTAAEDPTAAKQLQFPLICKAWGCCILAFQIVARSMAGTAPPCPGLPFPVTPVAQTTPPFHEKWMRFFKNNYYKTKGKKAFLTDYCNCDTRRYRYISPVLMQRDGILERGS